MHVIVGLAVLTSLVWYAFGPFIARIFLGSALGVLATLLCVVMGIAIIDMQRQDTQQVRTVQMGSAR